MSEVHQYNCHAWHASLEMGKASGLLHFTPTSAVFLIAQQRIELSLQGLRVKLGGAGDRVLFFSHDSAPDWQFHSSDSAILNNPVVHSHSQFTALRRKRRNKRVLNYAVCCFAAFLCVALPLLAWKNMPLLGRLAAEQVPVSWETRLGDSSFAQYRLNTNMMLAAHSDQLLKPLVAPLLNALPNKRFDYRFYITSDSDINAFALPGGIIVLNSGLILASDDASELLGVIAHEMVHVRERHGIRKVLSQAGLYIGGSAILGDASGVFAVLVDAAPLLINQAYSRDFEREADVQAQQLLIAANVDPRGLSRFFANLLAQEEKQRLELENSQAQAWLEKGMRIIGSHPQTVERIAQLERFPIEQNTAYRDLSREFKQLKTQVGEFVLEHENK